MSEQQPSQRDSKPVRLTRREFFNLFNPFDRPLEKFGLIALGGVGVEEFLDWAWRIRNSEELKKVEVREAGQVTTIRKNGATHIISYSIDSLSPKIDPLNLPPGLTGFFPEHGVTLNSREKPEEVIEDLCTRRSKDFDLGQGTNYSKIFSALRKKDVPIYLADIQFQESALTLSVIQAFVPVPFEALLGMGIIGKAIADVKRPLTRREFVSAMLKTLGGLYLTSPLVAQMALHGSIGEFIPFHETKELGKFTTKIHPEIFLNLTLLRSIIAAHKAEWMAQRQKDQGQTPTLLYNRSGYQAIFEDKLKDPPEKRLAELNWLKPIVKAVVVPESFYTLTQLKWKENRWQKELYEVPELKQFIET